MAWKNWLIAAVLLVAIPAVAQNARPPLLNPNNRAGFLNLGFFCGLGLLFRSGTRPVAALIGIGVVSARRGLVIRLTGPASRPARRHRRRARS